MNIRLLTALVLLLPAGIGLGDQSADQVTKFIDSIVIPKIRFEDTTVEEAIDFLRLRAIELDPDRKEPEKKGVSIVIRRSRLEKADSGQASGFIPGDLSPADIPRLTLTLDNATLRTVLEEVAGLAALDVHVTTEGVLICPAGYNPFPNEKAQSGRILSTIYRYKKPIPETKKGEQAVPPNGP
jgi:hypothetical protein